MWQTQGKSVEQRLEALKQRPTWADWLNKDENVKEEEEDVAWEELDAKAEAEYNRDIYADSSSVESEGEGDDADDEEEEDDKALKADDRKSTHGLETLGLFTVIVTMRDFLSAVFWSVTTFPLPVSSLLLWFRPMKRLPLRSRSWLHFYRSSAINIFVLGALAAFATILMCEDLSKNASLSTLETCTDTFPARLYQLQRDAGACMRALPRRRLEKLTQICNPAVRPILLGLVFLFVLLNFHRPWARRFVVFVALLFAAVQAWRAGEADQVPTIEIIDPEYAIVNEPLVVSVDGANLQNGLTISWVSYWGCAYLMPSESCQPMFDSKLHQGTVTIEFNAVDHFIPCVRYTKPESTEEEISCFDDLKLRVKDQRSVPGWSVNAALKAAGETALNRAEEIVAQAEEEAKRSLEEVREGILQKAVTEATEKAVREAQRRLHAIESKAQEEFEKAQREALKDASKKATERALKETEAAIFKAEELLKSIQAETSEALRQASQLTEQEAQAAREAMTKALESVVLVEAEAMAAIQAAQEESALAKEEMSEVFKAAKDEARAEAIRAAKDEIKRQQQRLAQELLKQQRERRKKEREDGGAQGVGENRETVREEL